jgi:hypothetical protein
VNKSAKVALVSVDNSYSQRLPTQHLCAGRNIGSQESSDTGGRVLSITVPINFSGILRSSRAAQRRSQCQNQRARRLDCGAKKNAMNISFFIASSPSARVTIAAFPCPNLPLPLVHGCASRVLHLEPIGRVAGAATVSAPRCIGCKRVIRITGVHEIGTRVAQQLFDLLDRFTNHAARLSGLNLAF